MNGGTGTRPNAPFVGKVPTGQRATVDEIENDLPDYATEPNVWEHAMRPRMYTVLKAHGIASPVVTTPIITAALAAAKAKKPGDVRTAFAMLSKYRRAALREQREYAAEKRRISEIRDWLIGPCGLPTPTVREMMKQSGTELQDRPLIERITDITMMAIDRQFNAHGQNKKHWAANYANPPVADFWQHVTGVAEENDWGLQERIGKLNIALGSVASIYWYPGTLDQARAAFDKTYCDKGDDEMGEAIKQQEATVELPDYAHDKTKLVNALPRHMMKRLNITDISGDMKACFPGGLATTIGADGPESAYRQAETYINERLAARSEFDAAFPRVNGQPVGIGDANAEPPETPERKDSPSSPENGQSQKVGVVETMDTVPMKTAPQSATLSPIVDKTAQPAIFYGESPCVVYPKHDGSVIYKGIRFSVTLRIPGGTFGMAIPLMEEFVQHIDWIDPSCRVNGQTTMREVTTQPSAPALPTLPMAGAAVPNGAPDNKGRVPGQTGTDQIAYIQRSSVNGKESIELWTSSGQWAEHHLRRDNDKALVAALGINAAGMEVGVKYPCKIAAQWVVTSNKNERGTYFRDVTALQQAAA